jgi:acyl-CoA reductase-like NAD-dependent aldehyde dehydrogenase
MLPHARPSTSTWTLGCASLHEEVFGPVVAIQPFDSEAEAIRLANDSIYGLSGSHVDPRRRLARCGWRAAVETGMISVNSSSSVHIEAPFGGMKASGIGREQGMAALDALQRVQDGLHRETTERAPPLPQAPATRCTTSWPGSSG